MVAIAVSMVMAMCRIFCQIVFVSISRLVLVDVFFFLGTDFSLRSRNFADYTDFMSLCIRIVPIIWMTRRINKSASSKLAEGFVKQRTGSV